MPFCVLPFCVMSLCVLPSCGMPLCVWLFAWCLFACWLLRYASLRYAFLRDTYMIVAFFSISSFYRGLFFTSFASVYTRFDLTLFTLRLLNVVIDIPSWRHNIGGGGWRTGRHTGWQSSSGRERDSLRHIGQGGVRDTCLYIGRLGVQGADRPTGWKSSRSIFPDTWWYTNWRFRYVFDKTT